MKNGSNSGKKSKAITVTKSDRRPVVGFGVPSKTFATTQTGRLKLIAVSLILLFMFSAFPLAAAGGAEQEYVTYTIIREFSGEVVDAGTGASIDNVTIEGEVHSTAFYFRVFINSGSYSYWIYDSSYQLRASGSNTLVGGRFVLPVSQFLEAGEHTYVMTAYASGYESRQVSGSFLKGEQIVVRIELGASTSSSGDFDMGLSSSSDSIVRTWTESTTTQQLSVTEYQNSGRSDGTALWSTDTKQVGKAEYDANPSRYQVVSTTYAEAMYNVPVYTWTRIGYGQKWKPGDWTTKTVPVHDWVSVDIWTWAFYNGEKTIDFVQTLTGYTYNYRYNEYHRDMGWFLFIPTGWGPWYYYTGGSESFSEYKGSSFTTGGGWYQGWYRYYWHTGSTPNYFPCPVFKIKKVVRWDTVQDKWIDGYWATDYSNPLYEWRYSGTYQVAASQYNLYAGRDLTLGEQKWCYSAATLANPGGITGYNVKYITGYQVQTALGGWVCTPAQREVTITLSSSNGFEGDVALSVDAPDGIRADLELESSGTAGELEGEVTGTGDTIKVSGWIDWPLSTADDYLVLRVGSQAQAKLKVSVDPSASSVASSNGVIVTARSGSTVRPATYWLRVGGPEDIKISSLELLGTDPSYATWVYRTSTSPQARLWLGSSGVSVTSSASISGPGYNSGPNVQTTSSTSVTHTFSSPQRIGRFNLNEELSYSGSVVDTASRDFYVVFNQQSDVAGWYYTATRTVRDVRRVCELHPFLREILDFSLAPKYMTYWGALVDNPVPGSSNRRDAADRLVDVTRGAIDYDAAHADHDSDFTILNLNGQNPAGRAAGDCSDFASAYASLARAIGLPVRRVQNSYSSTKVKSVFVSYNKDTQAGRWVYHYDEDFTLSVFYSRLDGWTVHATHNNARVLGIDERPGGINVRVEYEKGEGHAFCEVYLNGQWVHAEPQGGFNDPNTYLHWGKDFEYTIETAPGEMRADKLTTVKYAVGLRDFSVNMDVNSQGDGNVLVWFKNRADSGWFMPDYTVKDFRIELVNASGLQASITQLSSSTLKPGEEGYATLSVVGAVPRPGYYHTIQLELSYTTVNGDTCSKRSSLSVEVV